LVISAIYAGLVSGTLDPYHKTVRLSSVSPLRDLPPDSIPSMLSTLNTWSERCVSTLAELEKQIETVKAEALERHETAIRERDELDEATADKQGEGGKAANKTQAAQGDLISHLTRKLGAGAASKRGNIGLDREDSDDMDVDDDDEEFVEQKEPRAAKKRTFFGK
jgi:COP9 signalosome complex subunit 7